MDIWSVQEKKLTVDFVTDRNWRELEYSVCGVIM